MRKILRLFISLFYFPMFATVFTLVCACHYIGFGAMWFADKVLNPINNKFKYLT